MVVPSIWKENFPLVVLEAMSHGLPVIASNIGGLSELVLHNKTGLLVIPNNIRDLEAKILYYKNNQKLFGKYSKYTVNRFNKKLIDSIYIKSIISAYRSVIR